MFPRKHIYWGKPLKKFSEILIHKLEKFENTECQLLKINNFLQVPEYSPYSFSIPKGRHQNTFENLGLNDGRQQDLVTQCTLVPWGHTSIYSCVWKVLGNIGFWFMCTEANTGGCFSRINSELRQKTDHCRVLPSSDAEEILPDFIYHPGSS